MAIIKGKTISYPNRLLRALDLILEDEGSTVEEKLQAAKLMLEALPLRKIPKRRTMKEKAVFDALESARQRRENPIKENT